MTKIEIYLFSICKMDQTENGDDLRGLNCIIGERLPLGRMLRVVCNKNTETNQL